MICALPVWSLLVLSNLPAFVSFLLWCFFLLLSPPALLLLFCFPYLSLRRFPQSCSPLHLIFLAFVFLSVEHFAICCMPICTLVHSTLSSQFEEKHKYHQIHSSRGHFPCKKSHTTTQKLPRRQRRQTREKSSNKYLHHASSTSNQAV